MYPCTQVCIIFIAIVIINIAYPEMKAGETFFQ